MEHYTHHIFHTISQLSMSERSFLDHELMRWYL